MKKLLLTAVVAFCTLFASAQIMVVTTYDDSKEGSEQFTNKMGIGYQATEAIAAGMMKNGDDYDVFIRYSLKDALYASFTMPTEDGSDNIQLGLGFGMNIWNNFYFEPSYTMPMNEDANGDREGTFNFGMSYRF